MGVLHLKLSQRLRTIRREGLNAWLSAEGKGIDYSTGNAVRFPVTLNRITAIWR